MLPVLRKIRWQDVFEPGNVAHLITTKALFILPYQVSSNFVIRKLVVLLCRF